jgi:hypothetical protein
MKSIKLKPCPFCGSEEIESYGKVFYCCGCGAETLWLTNMGQSGVAKWTKRVADCEDKNASKLP